MCQENDSYRLMVENMPDAITCQRIIRDEQGNIVDYEFIDVNPAFEKAIGLKKDYIIGKKATDVLQEFLGPGFNRITEYERVALTGEHTKFEEHSEILGRWYEVTAYRDKPFFLVTVFRDITDHKQNSKNERWYERHDNKNGIWEWVWTHGRCTEWDSQGQPLKMAGIHTDITQRRLLEKDLREANEKLNAIFHASPLAITCIDSEGFVTSWNKAAENIFGWREEEVLGGFLPIIPGEKEKEHWNLKKKTFKGDSFTILDTIRKKKDGTLINVNIYTAPLLYEEGEAIETIAIFDDITGRKKMEQELIKANKLESLGLLAGGIAHDFNNLLAVILGNISISLRELSQEDRVFSRLENAKKAIQQAKNLTQQLQTFARGGDPIKKTASIEELIREVVSFTLSGSKVHCRFSFPEDLFYVDIDEGQIIQVVHNIIINAVQAMPEEGIINISAKNVNLGKGDSSCAYFIDEGSYIKLIIQDSGTGIPEKDIKKVFDPFFSTKVEGTGMGLATTYSIIKRHGGCITLESHIGLGTTFYIYLPASWKKTITKKEGDDKLSNGSGKVLIMDDEEAVRNVAGEMLNALGYEVKCAHNGQEAVQIYKNALENNDIFEAVILDLTVPGGIGGKKAAQEILDLDKNASLIVSSGYSEDPVLANHEKYGFKDIIVKPYKIEELGKVLSEA